MRKRLLIILDGLGDRPIKEFDGKTPLEQAKTPYMDSMAKEGVCGVLNAMPKDLYPTSEESHLAIFGYDFVKDHPGRGVFEALGIGIKLKKDEFAFRVDFATVDENLNLIDARAGVVENVGALAKAVDNLEIDGVTFRAYPSLLYRGVLVLSGEPVKRYLQKEKNAKISDTDPHKAPPHKLGVRVLHPKAQGATKEGKTVARALERYQLLTHEILKEHKVNKKRVKKGKPPANFMTTRGCGHLGDIKTFKEKYGLKAACVAGAPSYKGIASYLGMKLIRVRGATGTLNTNIEAKAKAAEKALKKYDFVFLHLKGPDIAAEEFGDAEAKKDYLERADKSFKRLTSLKGVTIGVTGDHSSVCAIRDHSSDPVPVLICGGRKDGVSVFGESSCKKGALGHIYGKDFMKILLSEGDVGKSGSGKAI